MIDPNAVRAIDFHTHAEEPCGLHADDGYDELQSTMATYFRAPWKHPPTMAETAAHYREQQIACVIFPVDAERETGYRRYKNEEVAQIAADNSDVLIPFASIDPAKGKLGAREARRLVEEFGVQGFKFHPDHAGLLSQRPDGLSALRGDRGNRQAGAVPHRPDRRRRRHAAAATDAAQIFQPDVSSTMSRSTFPTCRSSWRIPPSPGRKRRCRSPPTSRTSISTCQAGRQSIFRKSLSSMPTPSCARKMLFGSDWPMIAPERWLADFETIDIKPEVRPLILKENAVRLLKLAA